MATSSPLEAIAELQQVISQTEDTDDVLNQLLPQILTQLAQLGYPYQLAAALFLDANKQLSPASLAIAATPTTTQPVNVSVFTPSTLFRPAHTPEREATLHRVILTDQIATLITTNYSERASIQSVASVVFHPTKELTGALLLASARPIGAITNEEQQLIQLIAQQMSLIYRLQDTHNSLTNISQEVYKMNRELHQLDKMKTEFVTLASHELLTPISAIQGYLAMILDEQLVPLNSPDARRYLERVAESTHRLSKLVSDLLNVSRIEQGRLLVEKAAIDLNTVIESVIAQLKFKAEEKKLNLNWHPAELPSVYADHDKLEEVIINLVGNAIKYTEQGSITIASSLIPTSMLTALDAKRQAEFERHGDREVLNEHIEPERKLLVGGEQVAISVTDTGMGIDRDGLTKLFKKFSRAGDGSYTGNGLGLYISRSLIEMMHGRMWATSPGLQQGSTFACSLPLAAAQAEIAEAEKSLKTIENAKPLARMNPTAPAASASN
ncbi:HAMP domain-containing histidine kinase [Candidatus Berkelbacteria bacterium]|nr:HAMP domain-containing histidine kinase [Candidatus Berkelbacteria bacterium]